jgi:hypothetical protein
VSSGSRQFLSRLMVPVLLPVVGFVCLLLAATGFWATVGMVLVGLVACAGLVAWLGVWLFLRSLFKHYGL